MQIRISALVATAALCFSVPAPGQVLTKQLVVSGLSRPVLVTAPAGDPDRLFVVEQGNSSTLLARIRVIRNGVLQATPFLNIDSLVSNSGNERGLLGMAFHPDYWNNGYFYVNYTNTAGTTIIARYQNPVPSSDVASATSGTTLLAIAQPFSNHNGGMIAFGPDGYLYIGTGDGGSANDPSGNAQNLNSLLGKMLRIDVDTTSAPLPYGIPASNPYVGTAGARAEILHTGLRNPWRFSFDRLTGDLWIADVGQNAWEEVDFVPAGASNLNFGWRCMEGFACTGLTGCTCNAPTLTLPVHQYAHNSAGGFSISGGYVYRGCAIPGLQGAYFFADYVTNNIWSGTLSGSALTVTNRTAALASGISGISSFGEDGFGELYIVSRDNGVLYKLTTTSAAPSLSFSGTPTAGSTLVFNLASAPDAGRSYVFGISSGFTPGIALGDGRSIQLNLDDILQLALNDPSGNGIYDPFGTLGAGTGTASVSVAIPGIAGLSGTTFWAGFVALEPTASAGVASISCPIAVTLQ